MPEQNEKKPPPEKTKIRPKLEDMIPIKLNGEVKRAVLDIVKYCKGNKITYPWGTSNMWYLKFKGKHIGDIRAGGIQVGKVKMADNTWYVVLYLKEILPNKELVEKENLTETIWKYMKRCKGCSPICRPGRTMTILGKDFENVCVGGFLVRFDNPDTETIEHIKKLMDIIVKGASPSARQCTTYL